MNMPGDDCHHYCLTCACCRINQYPAGDAFLRVLTDAVYHRLLCFSLVKSWLFHRSSHPDFIAIHAQQKPTRNAPREMLTLSLLIMPPVIFTNPAIRQSMYVAMLLLLLLVD
nr:MAG TPA: hypothetical protein [Caudoviricetes sp.]